MSSTSRAAPSHFSPSAAALASFAFFATGLRAVLRALAKGQVRVLLVRADTRAAGFRCGTSGRLVPTAADCRGEGQPVPVGDVMAEAIADARREGAAVSVIRDADAAQPIDGLAALLRFA